MGCNDNFWLRGQDDLAPTARFSDLKLFVILQERPEAPP